MKWLLAVCAVGCLGVPAWADTYLVLPFFNDSSSNNLDWIGESVAETLRETLASQGLMTLDREDRQEAYRRLGVRQDAPLTRATIIKLGQALDAEHVIFGEFQLLPAAPGSTSRGSLKITAHILDLRHISKGPEFSEIAALEDLAPEQARLAWQTLEFVAPRTAPTEQEFRRQHPPVRVDAIENYIRGLLMTNVEQKQKLFAQAVRLEPGFLQASYQLGLLAFNRKDYKTAADWLQKVTPDVPGYRQATFYLGICRFETGNYAGAQTAFESIAKIVPLNEVYNNLGAAQSRLNRPDAIESFLKALEGDSSDPDYHFNVGYALWKEGKFEAATERFRAVLDRNPEDSEATTMLGRCLSRQGPQTADRTSIMERLKTTYEESAYWQLKAVLQPDKP